MANYRIADFIRNGQVLIMPDIQDRPQFPFTIQRAMQFFRCFANESFDLDQKVSSIIIYDGKEALPHHSYAAGHLYAASLEEIGDATQKTGRLPDPVGTINMEYGGTRTSPRLQAQPLTPPKRTKWVGDEPYTQCPHCGQWWADMALLRKTHCPGCNNPLSA